MPQILNTEGWVRTSTDGDVDLEFADDTIAKLQHHFETPLLSAGMTSSTADLINQWHELLQYAHEYLSVSTTPYRICWRHIFTSPRSSAWKDVLLLVELLFTVPISNAKLERMFSKLKQVKTLHRAALSQRRLESFTNF